MQQHSGDVAPKRLKWHGWTDRGKVRKNNEDAFLGLQFDAREVHHLGRIGEGDLLHMDRAFAVCDGMGGARAGEFASRIAVEQITKLLPRAFHQSAAGLSSGFSDILTELFNQIHRALVYLGRSYEECSGMETTLSLCWFTPAWVYFGNIGDSRIYYLSSREEGIRRLSHDDTHVGWLFRTGQINEREARQHPRRNVLQKALGGGNQFVDPQVGAVGFETGDRFLLCSDGLVEGLYDETILDLIRNTAPTGPEPLNPAKLLVDAAIERDGRDNTTAVVIEVL
jgi:protein phosphatase